LERCIELSTICGMRESQSRIDVIQRIITGLTCVLGSHNESNKNSTCYIIECV